jgi:thymidylate synthase
MNTVKDIKEYFHHALRNEEFTIDKTGVKTIEMINACFEADEPCIIRKPNEDYIKREIEWYEKQSLFVQDIPGETPTIWKSVASNLGVINSNYGFLAYHGDNWNQYDNVLKELNKNPESRRANMIYTRPAIWQDYKIDGMSDFICTNNVQYFIRNNKLITSVYMRSNDAVFGYNNDLAWQTHVRDKLLDDLDVIYEAGPIYWNVGSLHVYERHFKFIESLHKNCITGRWEMPAQNMIHAGTEHQKEEPQTLYDLKQQEIEDDNDIYKL